MQVRLLSLILVPVTLQTLLPSAWAQASLKGSVQKSTGTSNVEVSQRKTGAFLVPTLPRGSLALPAPAELPGTIELPKAVEIPFNQHAAESEATARLRAAQQRLNEFHNNNNSFYFSFNNWRNNTVLLRDIGAPNTSEMQEKVHAKLLELQSETAQGQALPRQLPTQQSEKSIQLPQPPLPVLRGMRKQPSESNVLSWDDWYKHLSELLRDPLLNAMDKFNAPAGANTVRVTVKDDHHLSIAIEKSGGLEFDTAIIEAYSRLDGSPELQFPNRTLRQQVTFLTDHSHATNEPVDDITVFTLKGDNESIFTSK